MRARLLLATLVSVTSAVSMSTAQPIPERLRLDEGDVSSHSFELDLNFTIREDAKNRRRSIPMSTKFDLQTRVLNAGSDTIRMEAQLKNVQSSFSNNTEADSSVIDTTVYLPELDGLSSTMDVSGRGRLFTPETFGDLTGVETKQSRAIRKFLVYVNTYLRSAFVILPDVPVQKGESWNVTVTDSAQSGMMSVGITIEGQYRYDDVVDTLSTRCARVYYKVLKTDMQGESSVMELFEQLSGEKPRLEGTVEQHGIAYVDLSTGTVVAADYTGRVTIDMHIKQRDEMTHIKTVIDDRTVISRNIQ